REVLHLLALAVGLGELAGVDVDLVGGDHDPGDLRVGGALALGESHGGSKEKSGCGELPVHAISFGVGDSMPQWMTRARRAFPPPFSCYSGRRTGTRRSNA